MQNLGRYSDKLIDFSLYTAPSFEPHLDRNDWMASCGNNAFYMLTGRVLKTRRQAIDDKQMISELRRLKYKVIPLSIANTIARDDIDNRIHGRHVLLVSQMMFKGEGSWAVIYDGQYYHNMGQDKLNGLEFVNRPILSAYLIFHKKWKEEEKKDDHDYTYKVTIDDGKL